MTSYTSMETASSTPYHDTSCVATGSMIKNRKIENIADEITQVHKLYLQRGFNIIHMHTDCEIEQLRKEITTLGINLNCASKK